MIMLNRSPKGAVGLLSLYVHFPFCKQRCIYCDFNTLGGVKQADRLVYHKALLQDLRSAAGQVKIDPGGLRSLYLGGGTPTLAPANWLVEVVDTVREYYGFNSRAEITVEANPGTLTLDSLKSLRQCGINRLSMGVQSLNGELLHKLGRIHSAQDVADSLSWAREVGFDNINLDLIYGLPGQTVAIWQDTVEKLLSFKPEHIACYALSVEEGTPLERALERGLMTLPSEAEVENMESILRHMLKGSGFEHYEISNWALPGKQCFHNKAYWRNASYLGVGAGAVSYYNGWRFSRLANPKQYAQAVSQGLELYSEAERLGSASRIREYLMLGLRRRCGVKVAQLLNHFPLIYRAKLHLALKEFLREIPSELFRFEHGRLRLTGRGRDLSNEIFVRLLECASFEAAFC